MSKILDKLRKKARNFNFCATKMEDNYGNYVHPQAAGIVRAILGDDVETLNGDQICEAHRIVIAAFEEDISGVRKIRKLIARTDQDNGGDLSASDFLEEVIALLGE